MGEATWARVQEIFHAAIGLGDEERSTYLDGACADDRRLRAEVEGLLSSHAARPDFLEAPTCAGRRIGGYEIVREIGAGGMGTVYEAIQDHPRRTVRPQAHALGHADAGGTAPLHVRGGDPRPAAPPGESPTSTRLACMTTVRGGVPFFAMEYIPEPRTVVEHVRDERLGTCGNGSRCSRRCAMPSSTATRWA